MKSVREAQNLEGKKVLVRVDWNVPIKNGEVVDDWRIKKSLPTLKFLKSAGAKVILATHLEPEDLSMEPLHKFVPEGMELLENLRLNPGEKENNQDFAKELASKADIFVNEAFSVSHREHASIMGVPKFIPGYAGLEFINEVENLSKAFNPPHPFVFILGGAKFETKLPLVNKFLETADEIFIAGAMGKHAEEMGFRDRAKVLLPMGDISALDADAENLSRLREHISRAKFVLWNGPLGKYEDGYTKGTLELAKILAESSAETIVGGADTLAAIRELNIYDKFTFVSSGGGAMLDFLANGTLPGIEALN